MPICLRAARCTELAYGATSLTLPAHPPSSQRSPSTRSTTLRSPGGPASGQVSRRVYGQSAMSLRLRVSWYLYWY
eukprot:3308714-Rhodomonas_salina.1